MNIHELNTVLCIAKHQNLTKAARELFISQPTLSKHLKKLERELGMKLFARIDNCYHPTVMLAPATLVCSRNACPQTGLGKGAP